MSSLANQKLTVLRRMIDKGEFAEQHQALAHFFGFRVGLSAMGFLFAGAFMPLWICALLLCVHMVAEVLLKYFLKRLANTPATGNFVTNYVAMMLSGTVVEIAFGMLVGQVWMMADPFAKMYAIGLIAIGVLAVSVVKSIHVPLGTNALLTLGFVSMTYSAVYWVSLGNYLGAGFSIACVFGAMSLNIIFIWQLYKSKQEMRRINEVALAADAAKSNFLAQMSHELRTPLNAILGIGEIERELSENMETKERMAVLVESARGLAVILDDILDLAAIQKGILPIRPTNVDPVAEIEAIYNLYRPTFNNSALNLDLEIDPLVTTDAYFDAQRMRQCLNNLLTNALKHTRLNKINNSVTISVKPWPGNKLCIEVQDGGKGIAADRVTDVFEPFVRANNLIGGTGLGLSISRQLARQLGGDLVLVPSKIGARFRLTLYMEPVSDSDEARMRKSNMSSRMPTPGTLRNAKVLIVDDIATNRLVATLHLRMLGADPVEAENGFQAVSLCAEWQASKQLPKMILLDIHMPGISGLETMKAIRALGSDLDQVPIFAMTADASAKNHEDFFRAGIDGVLVKPLSRDSVTAALSPYFEHD